MKNIIIVTTNLALHKITAALLGNNDTAQL